MGKRLRRVVEHDSANSLPLCRSRPYSAPSGSVPAAADMSLNAASSSSLAVLLPLLVFIGAIVTWDKIKQPQLQGKEKRNRIMCLYQQILQPGLPIPHGPNRGITTTSFHPITTEAALVSSRCHLVSRKSTV